MSHDPTRMVDNTTRLVWQQNNIIITAWPDAFSSGLVLGIDESADCDMDETAVILQKKSNDAEKELRQKWTETEIGNHKKFTIKCSEFHKKDMVLFFRPDEVFFYHINKSKNIAFFQDLGSYLLQSAK